MKVWPVQDAKAKFSEFLDASIEDGPQIVTRRGIEAAVLVSAAEWRRIQQSAGAYIDAQKGYTASGPMTQAVIDQVIAELSALPAVRSYEDQSLELLGGINLGIGSLNESLVAELARRKVFVDPTLTVFRNMILLPDVPEVRDHPDVALAPGRLRAFWPIYLNRSGCPQGGALEDRRREFAKYQELVGRLHRAGVTLLVGTDSPEPHVTPGFSLHQEMERLVEGSAEYLGRRSPDLMDQKVRWTQAFEA